MMISPVPASADRRASIRAKVMRRAVLRWGDHVEDIAIADLTREGCRIGSASEFPPFAQVSIGIAGIGHTPAQLVWRSRDGYGCAFDAPLPPGAVTISATSNVAYLTDSPECAPGVVGAPAKYSYGKRLAIIGGLTALLWSAIFGAGVLLAAAL